MKKHIILTTLCLTLISSLALSATIVLADPAWITTVDGPEGPIDAYPWINWKETGTGLHIINDPLFDSAEVDALTPMDTSAAAYVKGWVTFLCTDVTPEKNKMPSGFEYSITVKDVPQGTYTVKAYPHGAIVPPNFDWVWSDDLGEGPYTLGTFKVVGNRARGHLKGFYDMPTGFYAWNIVVEHSELGPIAETHLGDVADFLVAP